MPIAKDNNAVATQLSVAPSCIHPVFPASWFEGGILKELYRTRHAARLRLALAPTRARADCGKAVCSGELLDAEDQNYTQAKSAWLTLFYCVYIFRTVQLFRKRFTARAKLKYA